MTILNAEVNKLIWVSEWTSCLEKALSSKTLEEQNIWYARKEMAYDRRAKALCVLVKGRSPLWERINAYAKSYKGENNV